MASKKILLPYNLTAHEGKALDFVVDTFANREGIEITIFNAYTPLPEIDMKASPELSKIKSGMAFLAEELKKKEDGLIAAKGYLLKNGFSENQINYIFKRKENPVSDEIINIVKEGNYRVLVLCRQPGKVSRLFSRSIQSKVLSVLKDITICIAV